MELPKLIDNIGERVADDLRERLAAGGRVAVAAATFSIYAFETLKKELEQVDELRFIFTSPTFVRDDIRKEKREFYIPRLGRERSLYGTDFEIRLRNQLSQKAIARECADWIRRKARFRSNASHEAMGGFLYVEDNKGNSPHVYLPFGEFTTTGLGLDRGNNVYNAVNLLPSPMAEAYLAIFDEQWRNGEKFRDVTDRVLEYIETVYQENAPEYVYFVALYNIFSEFLDDISDDVLPNERTGFRTTRIWGMLYNFQRDAALAIINKLERYNGCILADSVGLGKTFTALAVVKYYEMRNKSVLVLCPKKLGDNWQTFRANYKNNPIAADRLRYDILFHSDLLRDSGTSGGIDLAHINWSNYDLVVIDESHNFRNGGNTGDTDTDDTGDDEATPRKETRYSRLMNRVVRQGVRTKVLMLSATPVNNRFGDLKSQLALAYEGQAATINDALGLDRGIDTIFREAQKAYNKWAKAGAKDRTTEGLLSSLSFDFFQMLDAVTIARSRSHIVKYYDTTDIGQFPRRLPPISRRPKLTDLPTAVDFKDIAGQLGELNLAIYTPSLYLFASARPDNLIMEGSGISIDGREKGLRRLMAANLLKRLESSVNSFRLTLERIAAYIRATIATIDNYESGAGAPDIAAIDIAPDLDLQDAESEVGKTRKISLAQMDWASWRKDLHADLERLDLLLLMLRDITPDHDTKLQTLIGDLRHKATHPINDGNRKVLIFTAFADTADYLYSQLADRLKGELGVETALITGATDGRCTLPKFKPGFNNVLTWFSPRSKDRDKLFNGAKGEIDILIATDCISEGQNLQDCDCVVNYDIHWNPVRIIQRFGRIDRIGSRNSQIQLINYWPDMELDDYIRLKGRVESRMKATILAATGDDNLLSTAERGDLEYRRCQLQRLQEEVVDIEDMDTGVNIMDLGLNEFRLDLLAYIHAHPDVEHAPFGLSAVVPHSDTAQPGVVFVLKNKNSAVNIDRKNLLHPFYIVYVADDGKVLCDHLHPKQLLDIVRHLCKGRSDYDRELCAAINQATDNGRNMERYSELLHKAIASIVELKDESDIDSLFSPGETTALNGEIRGLDDFELIAFLIVE